ncbi:hypothetical protein M6B38_215040 [Iris pallida]|uniref:Uncharacterized protein n=1 Tax=Iris pallida TaxID=29817 RepID=A0AAX6E1S7_IRIPA|nr:hypothetical protein M6B38_215040 [Iris pallida]
MLRPKNWAVSMLELHSNECMLKQMLSPRNWAVSTLSLVGKMYGIKDVAKHWVTTFYYPVADVEC